MALARYEPWNLMNQLQGELNRAFHDWASNETSSATADWVPAADVEEYEDRFELYVDLPGVAANDVEITLEGGVLSLSGERKVEHGTGQMTRHRRERGYGKFYRRFILPDTVNADAVKATERNGVLAVTIPKKAAAQPRRIEIAA
jgi:HSP20 family protein